MIVNSVHPSNELILGGRTPPGSPFRSAKPKREQREVAPMTNPTRARDNSETTALSIKPAQADTSRERKEWVPASTRPAWHDTIASVLRPGAVSSTAALRRITLDTRPGGDSAWLPRCAPASGAGGHGEVGEGLGEDHIVGSGVGGPRVTGAVNAGAVEPVGMRDAVGQVRNSAGAGRAIRHELPRSAGPPRRPDRSPSRFPP